MPRYWWWNAADLLHFLFNLVRHSFMCGIENIRIEFHPEDEVDGSKGVLRIVDTRDGTVLGSYNYAHTCPPDCA